MIYKINFESYSNNFALPQDIIDDNFHKLNDIYLKVALLIFRNSNKNFSTNLLSNLLNVSEEKICEAISYWIDKGLLVEEENDKVNKNVITISKSQAITPPLKPVNNNELCYLLECMENQLKRPVTSVEHKTVVHILEYIKLPADVVLMVIEYCIIIGKFNARYMEKVSTSWADKGIVTHELAEQYLQLLKSAQQNEKKVQKLFGIDNRSLIDSEREYINKWFIEYNFSIDMVKLAYEKTIKSISKLSFPYLNKILASWHEKGYKTIENVISDDYTNKPMNDNSSFDVDEIDKYWDNVPKLN